MEDDMRVALKALRQGDLVEFTWIQESGNGRWYRWMATAVFLEWRTDDYTDRVYVSYRPKAGTSYIEAKNITWVEPVKWARERLGMREDPDAKLPIRLSGAVDPPKRR